MSSSLLPQQCTACLVRLICMVLEMGGKWLYSCCFVRCSFQDMFNIARSILVQLPSSFFSVRFVGVHVVYPYSRIDKTTARKKFRFILLDRSDFHMIDDLSIADRAFTSHILMSFFVDLYTDFREPPFCLDISPYTRSLILSAFTWRPMSPTRDSAAGI